MRLRSPLLAWQNRFRETSPTASPPYAPMQSTVAVLATKSANAIRPSCTNVGSSSRSGSFASATRRFDCMTIGILSRLAVLMCGECARTTATPFAVNVHLPMPHVMSKVKFAFALLVAVNSACKGYRPTRRGTLH